jgi:tetratricopeptide (TPR) repeat protein
MRVLFVMLCFLSVLVPASESGRLTHRAAAVFSEGKLAKSYALYEKALLASRKESNLYAENRVLISMAQIRVQSLDFAFADSLLTLVRTSEFQAPDSAAFLQVRLFSLNEQGRFDETVRLGEPAVQKKMKNVSDALQAAVWSELTIAYAALGRKEDSERALKQVKKFGREGFFYFTRARSSQLLGNSNADDEYAEALESAIQNNAPFQSASILYYRGLLAAANSQEKANDFFLRSANAFELLGLPNNEKRSREKITN